MEYFDCGILIGDQYRDQGILDHVCGELEVIELQGN